MSALAKFRDAAIKLGECISQGKDIFVARSELFSISDEFCQDDVLIFAHIACTHHDEIVWGGDEEVIQRIEKELFEFATRIYEASQKVAA